MRLFCRFDDTDGKNSDFQNNPISVSSYQCLSLSILLLGAAEQGMGHAEPIERAGRVGDGGHGLLDDSIQFGLIHMFIAGVQHRGDGRKHLRALVFDPG